MPPFKYALIPLFSLFSYLDLRICMHPKSHRFYFVHGLYCEEITEPLQAIKQFMDDHPKEFIVFDCQHFYNFSNGDYDRLNKMLIKIFHDKFYTPANGPLTKLTLDYANLLKKQLMVVYRYAHEPVEFWPGNSWPTPWPNQIKVTKLKAYLDASLKYRCANGGYVSQCVLTPPVKFIVPRYFFILSQIPRIFLKIFCCISRFYSSLKKKCAKQVNKKLTKWIELQHAGPFSLNGNEPTSNVFIADFIELNNFQFCRTVIALNYKIFKEAEIRERDKNDNNENLTKNDDNVDDDNCECNENTAVDT